LQGHYSLAGHYAWPAFRAFLGSGRRQDLDLFFHLVAPGRAAVTYVAMFGGFAILIARALLDPAWLANDALWALWLVFPLLAIVQLILVLVVAPSLRHRRLEFRYVPDVVSFLGYGIRWVPSMLNALAARRGGRAWVKTEHTRSLSLDD